MNLTQTFAPAQRPESLDTGINLVPEDFVENAHEYHGAILPPDPAVLAKLSDESFLRAAEHHLFIKGYALQEDATKQLSGNGGAVRPTHYFETLFEAAGQDGITVPLPERMESLFIGAAAYGEDHFTAGALHRLVKLRGGYSEEFAEGLATHIREARRNEAIIVSMSRAAVEALLSFRVGIPENEVSEHKQAQHNASQRDRNLAVAVHTTIENLRPRQPRDNEVVWRPAWALVESDPQS